uniref:DNA mismatch repair protein n=1 Tax=Meloidogyne hapla TaxID=6305 RepID=A0A1I8BU48_MELHA
MSTKKKNIGRQSNLFTFFQRTPKTEKHEEIIDGSERNKTSDEAIDDLENIPSTKKEITTPSNKNSPKITNGTNKPKITTTPLSAKRKLSNDEEKEEQQQQPEQEVSIILDDDSNSGENVEGFLSCAGSSFTDSPASPQFSLKRRRIIISSDEEDVDDQNKLKTEKKMRKNDERIDVNLPKDTEVLNDVKVEKDDEKESSCEGKIVQDIPVDDDNSCQLITQKKEGKSSTKTHSFIEAFCFSNNDYEEVITDQQLNKSSTKILKTPKRTKISQEEENKDCDDHFPHLDFEFLKKPKDAQGKRPTDPEYDSRTLFIPPDFLKQQTPVGKFYELYHMDAVIAVENLSLVYMRGKYAHCGFPEASYGRYAEQLVNKGYKVARIEQTETPEQLAERQKKSKNSSNNCSSPRIEREKVVRRELCRLTTIGTKTFGILDGNDSRDSNDVLADPSPNYLLALTERKSDNRPNDGSSRFGVCFVDCSVGKFFLAGFDDDRFQSNLRTLFAHNLPVQLICEKGTLSSGTTTLLETMLSGVPKEILFPKRQFLTAEDTLNLLSEELYFGSNIEQWPAAIRSLLADSTVPKPLKERQLCISAFGAVLWYLRECLIDVDTISMNQFELYSPPSLDVDENNSIIRPMSSTASRAGKHTILDGSSLLNLHILPSLSSTNNTNSTSFSLFNTLNRCLTASGKRLLRQWISTPTCDREILLGRQSSIKWLMTDERRPHLAKWVELLKYGIHTIGSKYRADTKHGGGGHPDSRAQLFDSDRYNKRKIRNLLVVLDGLEDLMRLKRMFLNANEMAGEESAPSVLLSCFGLHYDEISEDLKFFKKAFDRESALEHGVIQPHTGVDEEYDLACNEVVSCESHLNEFLEKMKKRFKCSTLKFVGTGRNSYQLEIPDAYCKSLGTDFRLTSQRKGFKRYYTDELQQLFDKLTNAETQRDLISAEVTRRVFADFDSRKNKWKTIVNCLAQFDCLISLTLYAQSSPKQMCFPEFCYDSEKPFLSISKGFHPSLIDAVGVDYIPNDCELGSKNSAPLMLLTGANMGGKSTYMRQIAALVVMAQIGSMVPANSMKLTPVDRIFCRIGASDRLVAGQSTFYVELAETNIILRQATLHSLVLIDELGRGTSTFDGTAIAYAVLKYLSTKICCRALFSTHYHALCKFVANNPNVKLGHMACMVENANLEDPTMEAITFLYTLAEGASDKSYGFYTAKMAGIDVEIVRKAFAASKMLEESRQKH